MKSGFFFTDEQIDIIVTTLKNDILSNEDWIDDCFDVDEKEHFRKLIEEQKEIIEVLKCVKMLKIINAQTFKQLEEEVNKFIAHKRIKWVKFTDIENEITTRKTAYILYEGDENA